MVLRGWVYRVSPGNAATTWATVARHADGISSLTAICNRFWRDDVPGSAKRPKLVNQIRARR